MDDFHRARTRRRAAANAVSPPFDDALRVAHPPGGVLHSELLRVELAVHPVRDLRRDTERGGEFNDGERRVHDQATAVDGAAAEVFGRSKHVVIARIAVAVQ